MRPSATFPFADSNIVRRTSGTKVTTSSRGKVPLAGAVLVLDLNAELLNSLDSRLLEVSTPRVAYCNGQRYGFVVLLPVPG